MKAFEYKKEQPQSADHSEGLISESLKTDFLHLVAFLMYTFIMVYFVGGTLADLLMLPLVYLAYRSDRNYLWLVYFLIVNDAPGRLFSANGLNDARLPLYTLVAGISITFQEVFVATLLAKYFIKEKRYPYLFIKEIQVFFGIFVLYFMISFIIGISFDNVVLSLRYILHWSWLVLIPHYLNDMQKVKRAALLIFPFVFVALAFQIHTFLTGQYLDYMLRGIQSRTNLLMVNEEQEGAARVFSSAAINLYSLIIGLFFYSERTQLINNRQYLLLVIFTAATGLFLTATRGWIIAISIIFIGTALTVKNAINIATLFRLTLISIFLAFVLQWFFPLLFVQVGSTVDRLSTVLELTKGDVTAGGTLVRLNERGVRVLDAFRESPVIGFGFSDTFYEFNDSHVGNHSLLLNLGVIGYIAILGVYLSFCYRVWKESNYSINLKKYGTSLKVFFFALIAIFFIHSTSSQFWGYVLGGQYLDYILVYGFLFAPVNAIWLERINAKNTGSESIKTKLQLN